VLPHITLDGDPAEYICSLIGAIAVLVAGLIWRKRRLRHSEHPAPPAASGTARPIDRQ